MRKRFNGDIIPVETFNKGTWYMNVSNLSLSELIALRKELTKKSNVSISVLDSIIHRNANSDFESTNFRKREFEKRKQGYRNKKVLIKMKRRGR